MRGRQVRTMAGGRKGKDEYWMTEDGLALLRGWARDGLTDEQIAQNCGIRAATLYEWKKRYPEISESLKKGKEVVDIQVENALLKRALGYSYTETTKEAVFNPEKGESELHVTKIVEKQVAPDTTAQIFWLKNRRPDLWRDRKDVKMDAEVKTENPFEGLTTEELKKLIKDG